MHAPTRGFNHDSFLWTGFLILSLFIYKVGLLNWALRVILIVTKYMKCAFSHISERFLGPFSDPTYTYRHGDTHAFTQTHSQTHITLVPERHPTCWVPLVLLLISLPETSWRSFDIEQSRNKCTGGPYLLAPHFLQRSLFPRAFPNPWLIQQCLFSRSGTI